MEQAATQPARSGSTAPTLPVTAGTQAQAITAASAHTRTTAHTAQLEKTWWQKSGEPAVFWGAASAVATAGAIAAAFLVPYFVDRRQQRRRRKYAVAMLRPLIEEAATFEYVASECADLAEEIDQFLGRQQLPATQAVEWNGLTMKMVPTRQAYDHMAAFANLTLPEYAANRIWLIELTPEEAGEIESAYAEALRFHRDLKKWVDQWPALAQFTRANASMFKVRAEHIARAMRIVVPALAKATNSEVPEDWASRFK